MATLGIFRKKGDGHEGEINTLTLKAKLAIKRVDRTSGTAPDYRVYAGKTEIDAAWSARTKEEQRPYLNVKLDDPSFAAPAYCRLVDAAEELALIWNR